MFVCFCGYDKIKFNLVYFFILVKWCYFMFISVKCEYFIYLLKKIGSGILNLIKECRYLKLLLWKKKVVCVFYEIYVKGDV